MKPFKSLAEVHAYLDNEVLVCALCGRSYHLPANHLRQKHGMSSQEYKDLLGIPKTYPLASTALRGRLSAAQSSRIESTEEGRLHLENLIRLGKDARETSAASNCDVKITPAVRAHLVEQSRRGYCARGGLREYNTEKVETRCSDCGASFTATRAARRCPSCARANDTARTERSHERHRAERAKKSTARWHRKVATPEGRAKENARRAAGKRVARQRRAAAASPCSGKTPAGTTCRRRARPETGLCWQHESIGARP